MYCPSCGEEIPDDSAFCNNCGTPIPESGPSTEPDTIQSDTGDSSGWVSTLGKIGAYLVGAFLILSGLSGMADSVLAGLVFLIGGIFALPIVRSKLDESRGISIGTLATVVIVVGAVIIGGAVYNMGDVNSNSGPSGDGQAATQATITSAEQVIEKPATDLVIQLDQLEVGWSGEVDGNQTNAESRYYDSEEGAILQSTAKKYDTVENASTAYGEMAEEIQDNHATESVGIGDESLIYMTRNSAWVVFRDTNVVAELRYSHGYDLETNAKDYAELMHENYPQQ